MGDEYSQWFTPPWLADALWRWACTARDSAGKLLPLPQSILEPSAGHGSLLWPLIEMGPKPAALGHAYSPRVDAVEIVEGNCAVLRAMCEPRGWRVHHADFLEWVDLDRTEFYDLCLMNPKYEEGHDVRHVSSALGCSRRVVGVFASRILHSRSREEFWRWTDIARMAVVRRPNFGQPGRRRRDGSRPESDYLVLELRRRTSCRVKGEPTPCTVEWWFDPKWINA